MRNEIKFIIYIAALGGSIVAYAHANFMPKTISELIFKSLERIENKIDYTNQRIDRLNEVRK